MLYLLGFFNLVWERVKGFIYGRGKEPGHQSEKEGEPEEATGSDGKAD